MSDEIENSYLPIRFKELLALNKKALALGYSRTIDVKKAKEVFQKGDLFLLNVAMIHNDSHWRCQVTPEKNPSAFFYLDVSFDEIDKLREGNEWIVYRERVKNGK